MEPDSADSPSRKRQKRYLLVMVTPQKIILDEEAPLPPQGAGYPGYPGEQPAPPPTKPSEESPKKASQKAAALVRKYRQACSEGREEEARKLGREALKLDPTCFGKTP